MTTTLTSNLKLRIDSKLTSNAKYNLQRIDLLGATFLVDSTNTLNIRSQTDVLIDANSPDLGGTGRGSVIMGDADRKLESLTVYADELLLDGAFNLLDQAATSTGKLGLLYNSETNGALDSEPRTLTLDVEGADRSLVLGGDLQLLGGNLVLNVSGPSDLLLPTEGTLSTLDGEETLTNKTIDAEQNTLSNISNAEIKAGAGIEYSKLNLVSSIVNADINSAAAIAYSKLNLAGSLVNSDIATSAAIAYSKLALTSSITNTDISTTADIAYSKLKLTGELVDADIKSNAAIAYSKLSLSNNIKNSDISASPLDKIVYSKLDLTGYILNSDISPGANIDYDKLDLAGHITNSDIASGAAIAGTKVAPQFGNQNIRTSASLELDNGTYLTSLAPASSGQTQNLILRLPNSNGTANAILATDGAGNLRWSSSGSGSVTSVDLAASTLTDLFTVSGSPITTSGTIALTKANQASNQVYAGPASGAATQPSFRSLVLADLPAISASDIGLGNVPNVDATNPANIVQTSSFRFVTDTEKSTWNGKQNALGFTPENAANRGTANGYAPLNASGKIENSYLNTTVMNYHGTWNAATNTPALADGMVGADPGDVYIVSVAGTQNLGSGSLTFAVGDWIIYDQSNVWQKVINSNAVTSVNGAQGAVTVNAINQLTGDVTAGPASGSQSQVATIAAGAITNAKVSASAAIAVSKLATGTNGQVLQVVAGVPTWGAAPTSVASFKTDWVTADGTTKIITHNLASNDVMVQVYNLSTFEQIEVDTIIRNTGNQITLTASQAPGWTWRVLILAV